MNAEARRKILMRIAEHIRHTTEYCENVSQEEFNRNRMLQEACIFNIAQIGELAGRAIEYGLDTMYPEIEWRQMRGMRNRIIHDYEGIQLDIVWHTIRDDFPTLLKRIECLEKPYPCVN